MSIRIALALALIAAPAGAAPLCHDLRGLYTPCPPGQATAKPRPGGRVAQRADRSQAAPAGPAETSVAAAEPVPAKKSRPSIISQGHTLCRDTKGLYTPCPH